ncbi:hypothetical protein HID58_079830 [Brassica napus]|uniref:Uncharacterized protein n=1 Tax=Brassica napus TaxID=3708 RepID=A0ABQ7Y4F7_BRANA|nr:hypothetical protein HID58_079830 [Brassica napus]
MALPKEKPNSKGKSMVCKVKRSSTNTPSNWTRASRSSASSNRRILTSETRTKPSTRRVTRSVDSGLRRKEILLKRNNYYQKHAKQQEGVDKEEKTMNHHYSKNQRGYKEPLFKKATKTRVSKQRKESFRNKAPLRIANPQRISGWQPGRSSPTDDPGEPPCPAPGHKEGIPRRSISGERPPKDHDRPLADRAALASLGGRTPLPRFSLLILIIDNRYREPRHVPWKKLC